MVMSWQVGINHRRLLQVQLQRCQVELETAFDTHLINCRTFILDIRADSNDWQISTCTSCHCSVLFTFFFPLDWSIVEFVEACLFSIPLFVIWWPAFRPYTDVHLHSVFSPPYDCGTGSHKAFSAHTFTALKAAVGYRTGCGQLSTNCPRLFSVFKHIYLPRLPLYLSSPCIYIHCNIPLPTMISTLLSGQRN